MKILLLITLISFEGFFIFGQTINNQLIISGGAINNTSSAIYPQIIKSLDINSYGTVKMRLAPLIQKSSGSLHPFFAPSNKFWHERSFFLDSLVVPDSTIFIDFGYHEDHIDLREDRCWSIAGFEISNMPKLGDTAVFEFCLLTTNKGPDFSPDIYFSKDMIFDQHAKIKDLSKFHYVGKLNKETIKYGLEYAYFKVVIDERFSDFKWIHLVNHYPKDENAIYQIGLVAPMYLVQLNNPKNNSSFDSISFAFDFNSFTVTRNMKEILLKLKNSINSTEKIKIRSYISANGNADYNFFVSNLRVQHIITELNEIGIPLKNIVLEPTTISTLEAEEFNRIIELNIIKN